MIEEAQLGSDDFPFIISRHDGFIHATRDIKPGEEFWMTPGDYLWLRRYAAPDPDDTE